MTSYRPRRSLLATCLVFTLPGAVACALTSAQGGLGTSVGGGSVQAERRGDALTLLSLNLAMREDVPRLITGLRRIGGDKADLLVLQEVVARTGAVSVAEQLADALGFAAVFRPAFTMRDGRTVGLATLSRRPFVDTRVLALRHHTLAFRSRTRVALAVTLVGRPGPIHLYNVHLDTRINAGDRLAQVEGVIEDTTRVAHARAIDGGTNGTAVPLIIAGDFNTNEHHWLLHAIPLPFLGRQGAALERYMAQHGLVSALARGATHDVLGMRLDWVFLRGLEPVSGSIHPLDVSDHHAVTVTMVLPSLVR